MNRQDYLDTCAHVIATITAFRNGMAEIGNELLAVDEDQLKMSLVCATAWLDQTTAMLLDALDVDIDTDEFFQGLAFAYQTGKVDFIINEFLDGSDKGTQADE